ncbi:hypothetical protein [Flavobacterium sp.]|uniref:hypothetical protein n=1 Tax=Flavobacterium sp. TaxID=239 RepID=UPI003527FED0
MKNTAISFGIVFIYLMLFLFKIAKPAQTTTQIDLNKNYSVQSEKTVIVSERLPIVMTKKD